MTWPGPGKEEIEFGNWNWRHRSAADSVQNMKGLTLSGQEKDFCVYYFASLLVPRTTQYYSTIRYASYHHYPNYASRALD